MVPEAMASLPSKTIVGRDHGLPSADAANSGKDQSRRLVNPFHQGCGSATPGLKDPSGHPNPSAADLKKRELYTVLTTAKIKPWLLSLPVSSA